MKYIDGMTVEILTNTSDVIDRLGGTSEVAKLTGKAQSAVCNWRKRGAFPADTFLIIGQALQELSCSAPPLLWRISDPAEAAE